MSSIPNDNDAETPKKPSLLKRIQRLKLRDRLPPFPENEIILYGDIIALFVYAFLDHFAASSLSEESTIASFTSSSTSFLVPVWSDASQHNAGVSLISKMMTEQRDALISSSFVPMAVHYSPCLAPAGVAAVLFGACWLVAGYFNGAFEYKNTFMCKPDQALIVTGRTWVMFASMMVGLALLSDNLFCGCNKLGGLSQSDAAFIFDSLTVLITWRFMAAWMLNGL
eukprot:CAMPEP_0172495376 /NCGR_PEP_ID=MMETSP1066-20121228/69025_1 /TAXON_ID=671091 /ORGANISM="Coscinodiscus wailesii, Strain CCMP2513" /LENGTH=224 /DNA_ID=CAMNT_0013266999 /DNA_START=430 /DNA_END=1104 /DNA_ORIENTATION=+